MNLKFRVLAMFIMALATVSFLPSCGSDDEPKVENVDKTELNNLIAECEALLAKATTDDYPEEVIATFQSKVTAVKSAVSGSITQSVANNLLVQLKEAKTIFVQSAYGAIPTDKLLVEWNFDEGTGNSVTSTGVEKWVAQFNMGPAEVFATEAAAPVFVDGVRGKALNFDKGAFLAVNEFNESQLLSNELSISMWVNPKEVRPGNYLLSMNYWENWKLNLQENSKPLFTVATTVAGVDADNEIVESVPVGQWSHIVVTMNLNTGKLSFYVNGEDTKTWDSATKPGLAGKQKAAYVPKSGKKLPFLIGCATTFEEVTSWAWTTLPVTPAQWDGYIGQMDEVKIYTTSLTEGQVKKLYNDEKK